MIFSLMNLVTNTDSTETKRSDIDGRNALKTP